MGFYSFSYFLITVILYSLFGLGIYRFFVTPKSIKEGLTVFFVNLIIFLIIYPTGNLFLWFIIAGIIPIPLGLIFKSFTKWSLIKYIVIIILILMLYLAFIYH
jgi:antibiotic biosynthesis monooxygenase (ABM) superfamily enzyme